MPKTAWFRIIPFAVFMLFIAVQQGLQWAADEKIIGLSEHHFLYLYPIKTIIVLLLLFIFMRHYDELHWRDLKNFPHTAGSILLGIIVFALWINMDWDFATFGESQGFNPFQVESEGVRSFLVFIRIFGAAIVVPLMEELFWRSFLLRYIIDVNFAAVKVGTYTFASFAIGSVLFGFEHNLVLAGIMAGVAYSLLLYWTKSITQCVLAHAVTNFILGLYVLQTANWQFW